MWNTRTNSLICGQEINCILELVRSFLLDSTGYVQYPQKDCIIFVKMKHGI